MKYLLIYLLLLTFSTHAQKIKSIQGHWIYSDIEEKEKLDSATLRLANGMFNNLEIEYNKDGSYIYGKNAKGTWKLNKEENKVLTTTPNLNGSGEYNSETNIVSLTDKQLRLKIWRVVVIFNRTTKPKATTETVVVQEKVSEEDPFEIVKFVRSGSAAELQLYCQKRGHAFSTSSENGKLVYKSYSPVESGVESFSTFMKKIEVVTFKFKDHQHKFSYMEKLKEEGFEVIELSNVSTRVRKDGVDIWFILGSLGEQTWIISKMH